MLTTGPLSIFIIIILASRELGLLSYVCSKNYTAKPRWLCAKVSCSGCWLHNNVWNKEISSKGKEISFSLRIHQVVPSIFHAFVSKLRKWAENPHHCQFVTYNSILKSIDSFRRQQCSSLFSFQMDFYYRLIMHQGVNQQ